VKLKKKYYCGKCNKRFSKRVKHCPNCGALVSIPLHLYQEASTGYTVHYMWREAIVILVLLGIATYLISSSFLKTRGGGKVTVTTGTVYIDKIDGTPYRKDIKRIVVPKKDEKKYRVQYVYGFSPEHADDIIAVKTGIMYVCDPCGEIVDDQTKTLRVRRDKADKYKVRSLSVPVCHLCDNKTGASVSVNMRSKRAPSGAEDIVVIGMKKPLVNSLWGSPVRRQRFMTPNGIIERVYYGDPIFGISNNNRYVEYDSQGRVVLIHEMDGM